MLELQHVRDLNESRSGGSARKGTRSRLRTKEHIREICIKQLCTNNIIEATARSPELPACFPE